MVVAIPRTGPVRRVVVVYRVVIVGPVSGLPPPGLGKRTPDSSRNMPVVLLVTGHPGVPVGPSVIDNRDATVAEDGGREGEEEDEEVERSISRVLHGYK